MLLRGGTLHGTRPSPSFDAMALQLRKRQQDAIHRMLNLNVTRIVPLGEREAEETARLLREHPGLLKFHIQLVPDEARRGVGDCADTHSPVADARTAAATRDAHRADIEAALLAANGAVERARADVARLQRRLANSVLV